MDKISSILSGAVLTLTLFGFGENNTIDAVLSRSKRYLLFPEGSTLSVAICMTAQTGITPGEIFTEGINWGISYNLPNSTSEFKEYLNKPTAQARRRHRRDLYGKIEKIIKSMGYDGRHCILRAICETSHKLQPSGESLLDEILKIVYPTGEEVSENCQHEDYSLASHVGINKPDNCFEKFSGCPFSLIDLVLGYYSKFV